MSYWNSIGPLSAYEDVWESGPTTSPFAKWFGGAVVPLLLLGYGLACFITHHGLLSGEYSSLDLFGPRAIALGIAVIGVGVFLHCHFFWENLQHFAPWAVLGQIIGLMGFVAAMGYLIVQIGIWGRT